jgi:hypothetical protein
MAVDCQLTYAIHMSISLVPEWKLKGACAVPGPATVEEYDHSYPQGVARVRNQRARNFIRVYCYNCPVIEKCAQQGKTEQYGIWGGKTEEDRKQSLAIQRMML